MIKRLLTLLAIVMLAALLVGPAVAQTVEPAGLVLLHKNQMYIWRDGAPQPVGDPLPESRDAISISPDGSYVVFRAEPESLADQIAAECPCGGSPLPSDLTLIDTATGTQTLIAGQAEGITLVQGVNRSVPVWAPTGTKLAWVEGVEGGTLVVYDILSGQTTYATDDLPNQTLVSNPAELESWTGVGILVRTVDFGPDLRAYDVGYRFYAPDGTIITETPARQGVRDAFIVHEGSLEFLAVKYESGWELIDPGTGQSEPLVGALMLRYAAASPETSVRIVPAEVDDSGVYSWQILSPEGEALDRISPLPPRISPDGRTLLMPMNGTTMEFWRSEADGGPFTLELPWEPDAVTWSDIATEFVRGGDAVTEGPRCLGSDLSFRLSVDGTGVVLGTTPNNVRAQPSADAENLGQIAAGDWFTVTDGPTCSGGIAWWQVRIGPLEGWTAEGADGEYWLRPGCPESGCARG